MPPAPHLEQRRPHTRIRTRRRVLAVCAAVGVVMIILLTAYLAQRALVAKAALESAQQELTTFRSTLGQPGAPSTTALHARVQGHTSRAVEQTDDPVWSVAEYVPVVGANLLAFRQAATLVDDCVRDGVGPLAEAAEGLSLEDLKPRQGRIDIRPLTRLTPAVAALDDAVQQAATRADGIDTDRVVRPLAQQVETLQSLLADAAPTVHQVREIMPALYPALGGEGTRHYLLIFQNNAEERSSGGNPAAMAMLLVEDGKISLGRQGSSAEYPHPYRVAPHQPSGPGNADWDTVYTTHASNYVTNITMTPDFPTTAQMARAMWRDVVGGTVDGVVSLDPVALSYLLRVTGPVTLLDGTTITAGNAVSYLLYEVYAKHSDGRVQDAVFASATQAVFDSLTAGEGDARAYLAALKPMVREQRLKLWSVRESEQALLRGTRVGNMLPDDNRRATVLGVYNNDDATSKMSYFMDQSVRVETDTCGPTPRYTVAATVVNTLPKDQVDSLPEYVKPHQDRVMPGGDRQWVQLYGPVGGELVEVRVDDKLVRWGTSLNWEANTNQRATGVPDRRPAVQGTMYGRPVGVVSIKLGPTASTTVTAEFVGSAGDSRTVEVSHTPKVRDVPVTVTPACGQ